MGDVKPENLMDMPLDGLDALFAEDGQVPALEETVTRKPRDLRFFRNIPVTVTLEVASAEVPLGSLMQVGEGAVIALDKQAGEPLDVRVNGRLLARAEVVVVNGNYGLRLLEVVDDQALGDLDS